MPGIDELWEQQVNAVLQPALACSDEALLDPELLEMLQALDDIRKRLEQSSEESLASVHHDTALDACRLTRKIRFHIGSPSLLANDVRSQVMNGYASILKALNTRLEPESGKASQKTVANVKRNIKIRLQSFEDGLGHDAV